MRNILAIRAATVTGVGGLSSAQHVIDRAGQHRIDGTKVIVCARARKTKQRRQCEVDKTKQEGAINRTKAKSSKSYSIAREHRALGEIMMGRAERADARPSAQCSGKPAIRTVASGMGQIRRRNDRMWIITAIENRAEGAGFHPADERANIRMLKTRRALQRRGALVPPWILRTETGQRPVD